MAPVNKSTLAASYRSLKPARPAKNSREFDANDKPHGPTPSFAEPDDYSVPKKSPTRSVSYAVPLNFLKETDNVWLGCPVPLTRENLEALQDANSPSTDSNFPPYMRKSKSRSPEKKKLDKRKGKEENTHPLNFPPDELRRWSQRVARDEERASTHMDAEMHETGDAEPTQNGTATSPPATPAVNNTPGAFPTSEVPNGTNNEEQDRETAKSPTPPPHRIQPKIDPEACKAAGNKYFKAKDYDRAIAEYSKAVEAEPSNPTYLSNRAAAYMSANKFGQALGDSIQASRLDPKNDKILHRLARIYTSLGRPQDALDTYTRIPNASATDTSAARKAVSSIATAERQIQDPEGNGNMALWSIEQAKQTLGYGTPMPRSWQIMKAKANLKVGSANALGEVQAIAQSLMRENPMDAEAIVLAGRAFYLKDEKGVGKSDYQRAEECFRQALNLDPDMADARNSLRTMKKLERARNDANDLYKRGRWQEAIIAYDEAIIIDAANKVTNAKILGNRAMANTKLKNYDDARSDCDQALKFDPSYSKAKKIRAKAVGESGNWEQAVKDLKALVEDNQNDVELQKELRNAELELKKSKRKDWYKILGVDKEASDKEIERAYKKKAAVLHPDKTQGDKEKEEQFKDCLEAKETLLDPQKRQMFDSGADLMEPGMGGGMGGFPGGFGGMGGGMGGGVQIDPEMLFNMMGGMNGGRGGGAGGAGGMPHFNFGGAGGPHGGRGGFPFG